MKVLMLLSLLTFVYADVDDCECWEDWSAESDDQGDYCLGPKNQSFACNQEKPPLCICEDKDTEEKEFLELGSTHCHDVKYKTVNCGPEDEWDPYLERNPQYRILHQVEELSPPAEEIEV